MAIASGEETIVKSDCLELVDALRKPPFSWPWLCAAWLYRMKIMLQDNRQVRVNFRKNTSSWPNVSTR
ncbi:hypothetical protein LINPERHAP2_LOCUS7081 [Linum perenne]